MFSCEVCKIITTPLVAASVAKTDQKKQKDILRIEWRKETEVIAKLNESVFWS